MPQRWQILKLTEESETLDELISAICRSPDIADCDEASSRDEVLAVLGQYREILPASLVAELDQA